MVKKIASRPSHDKDNWWSHYYVPIWYNAKNTLHHGKQARRLPKTRQGGTHRGLLPRFVDEPNIYIY